MTRAKTRWRHARSDSASNADRAAIMVRTPAYGLLALLKTKVAVILYATIALRNRPDAERCGEF